MPATRTFTLRHVQLARAASASSSWSPNAIDVVGQAFAQAGVSPSVSRS